MKGLRESILDTEQEIQQHMDDATSIINNSQEFRTVVESFISQEGLSQKFNIIRHAGRVKDFDYTFNITNNDSTGLSFTAYYYSADPGLYFYMTYWSEGRRVVYDVFGDYEIDDSDKSFYMRSDCEGAMANYSTLQSIFNIIKYIANSKSKISSMIADNANKFYPTKWNSIIKMIKRAS